MRQSMTRSDATDLTGMMVDAVANGSGAGARISGVDVAGKTGTAETGFDTPPHAWMVSFAPANNPVIALAVIVEEGGDSELGETGGVVAAPIARAVMEEALRLDAEGDL
jgi:peptidoglycan glycosyltransferase